MARKLSGPNMSMNELLSALTLAQKERDATLEELRKFSEGERKKAELAEQRAGKLQQELDQTRKKVEELTIICHEFENRSKLEKENYERQIKKNQEEHIEKIKTLKEKLDGLQQELQEIENCKSVTSEELSLTKKKLQKALLSEENLESQIKKMKDELAGTKDELSKALKNQEILESQLHMAKMQILKESNVNNRLLDELKRARKEIDEYKDEISNFKKLKDNHRNSISKQIKELSILISENNKDNFDDNLREIRISLSTILKENFVLNNRINDVYKFLTKGDAELVHAATQTSIGLDQMFSYENMDREVTNLVMRLREDLVSNKSDLLEMKHQNEMLKGIVRELKREKERNERIEEEENRVEKLEDAVRSLKQMLQEPETANCDERDFTNTLDKMRKDIDMLKNHIKRNQRPEAVRDDTDLYTRPIRLITSRK